VAELRALGHDVLWICEVAPGAPDTHVLALADGEGRVILTFDKDFGELACSAGLPAICGVVLFRVPTPPVQIGQILAARLKEHDDCAGHFSAIEPGRVRLRELENKGR
jgi:predicted nuclease of predicted toxin-antitoxin system